jgi:hypothetical protein
MMNDNFAVASRVNIELYCVCPDLERSKESRNRVFREVGVRSAVGYFQRLAWTGGQSDLVWLG